MSLTWELVETVDNTNLYRSNVTGGWLLKQEVLEPIYLSNSITDYKVLSSVVTFMADATHLWSL